MITRYLSRVRSFFRTKRRLNPTRRATCFRRWFLECETLENRCVPTAHAFLQGFTFLDLNNNGQFDSGEGQANNTLQLFAADLGTAHLYGPSVDLTTVLGTTSSSSIGYYIFNDSNVLTNNLRPGNYRIVETPVAGFTNGNVDLHSTQIYPSSRVSASTIQVTLVDPTQLLDHFHGFGPGAQDTPILNGTPLPGFTGQLIVDLTSKAFVTPNFFSLCLDLTQTVGGGVTFPVQPGPMSTAFPNGAEIAFLYNHFGTTTLSNTDAEALQQAVWELIYGAAFVPDLSHPGVAAAYNNFLSLANGSAEDAIFLHAVNPLPRHGQSMIATGSLNFSNIATPTIVTMASETGGGVVGTAMLNDSAVLTGTFMGTGTITFTLTQPDGTTITVGTDTVMGDGTYVAPSVLATQVGTYTWHASYSGDSLNNGAIDNGNNESLTTIKTTPTIVTMASETGGGVVGTAMLNDSAVLTGTFMGTGTITFTLTQPDGTTITVGTDTVMGDGTYVAPSVLATQVGTYTWHASYSGDSLNNGAIDNGNNESLTTVKTTPTIVTMASLTGTATLNDSAVLTGTFMGTGTITFTLTQPDGTTITVGTDTVHGDGTYVAPSVLATQTGTYTWHASYSGDSLNNGAIDNGNNESLSTGKTSPTIVTMATETGGGVVGTAMLNDSAVLTGTFMGMGTGTITFTLAQPDGTTITVGTDTVHGDGTYVAPSVLATQVGTYTWHASYSGDNLNNGAIDNGNNESITTIPASPSITTVPGPTIVLGSGDRLTDTATLSGGFNPTGTITFTLHSPSNVIVDTETVQVHGDGTYVTPLGFLPTAIGTYQWVASYGGDANNNAVSGALGDEPQTVTSSMIPIGKIDLLGSNFSGSGDGNITENVQFVNSIYHNLLARAPDQAGLTNWFIFLESGGSRFQVAQAIWQSPEHRDLEVEQYYETILHRTATPGERAGWVGAFLAGATETDIEFAFLNSSEYLAAHGSATSFINGLYADVLGRNPSSNELSAWQQALASGLSRSNMDRLFLSSTEFDVRVLDGFYSQFLNRPPDAAGEQGWLGFLRSGGSIEAVAESFLASTEYYQSAH